MYFRYIESISHRFDEIISPSKMKIFQTIQRHYVSLGISSSVSSIQKYPINTRVFIGFLLFGLNAASQLIYIIYVANDFMGYMEVICASSGSTIIFVCFAAIVHKMTLLFETIDSIEKLIDSREPFSSNLSFPFSIDNKISKLSILGWNIPKSRRFFLKRGRRTERLSEMIFMVVMKILVQLVMLPKIITSYCVYFLTDLGSDSFQLPLPMW